MYVEYTEDQVGGTKDAADEFQTPGVTEPDASGTCFSRKCVRSKMFPTAQVMI